MITVTLSNEILKYISESEIWIKYFLRMVKLYSAKVYEISVDSNNDGIEESLSFLKRKEKDQIIQIKRLFQRQCR